MDGVVAAYYAGLRDVFIMYVPIAFACFLFCLGAEDVKLDDAGPKVTPGRTTAMDGQEGEGVEMEAVQGEGEGKKGKRVEGDEDEEESGKEQATRAETRPSNDSAHSGILASSGSADPAAPVPARIKLPEAGVDEGATATSARQGITRKSSRKRIGRPNDERDEL